VIGRAWYVRQGIEVHKYAVVKGMTVKESMERRQEQKGNKQDMNNGRFILSIRTTFASQCLSIRDAGTRCEVPTGQEKPRDEVLLPRHATWSNMKVRISMSLPMKYSFRRSVLVNRA